MSVMFPKPGVKRSRPSIHDTGLHAAQSLAAAEGSGRLDTLTYQLTLQPQGIHSLARLAFEITVLAGSAWISHDRNDFVVKAGESIALGASDYVTVVSAVRSESMTAEVRIHGHPDDIAAIRRAHYEHVCLH